MFFFWKKKESPEAAVKEAEEHLQRGRDLTVRGQSNEAEKEFLKSLSILEPLSSKSESPVIDQELAKTYDMLCLMCLGKNTIKTKQADGVAYGKKAVEIRKKLAAQDPTVDALDKLAYSYSNLGYAEGDFFAGNQALDIWEDLQKRFPTDPTFAKRVEDQKKLLKQLASEYGI